MARTGRIPVTGESRSHDMVHARLSLSEGKALDAARTQIGMNRSDFVRSAIIEKVERTT